jgi:hypothetical protein
MSQRIWATQFGLLAVATALCLTLSGCGGSGKISKANADKIKAGMTESEVTAILGAPTENVEAKMPDMSALMPGGMKMPGMKMPGMGGIKSSVWKDGDRVITVSFMEGKVMTTATTGF